MNYRMTIFPALEETNESKTFLFENVEKATPNSLNLVASGSNDQKGLR